jgi:hypothetical protein
MKTNHKLALAVLAGISIGLLIAQAIHAQQVKPPPAYILAEVEMDPTETQDPAALEKYKQEAPKSIAAFGDQR